MCLRKAVLEQNGYDVIGVTSADEALDVLRKCPVCLVLTDHMLRDEAAGIRDAAGVAMKQAHVMAVNPQGQETDVAKVVRSKVHYTTRH